MLAKASMLLRRTLPFAVANMTCSLPQLFLILGQRQHGADRLALSSQRQQVDHRPPARRRAAFGQAPHLHAIDLARVEKNSTGVWVLVTNIAR
jgi:hypothetical protein